MEAGRELDAEIARMLGWTDVDVDELTGYGVAPGEQWISRYASPFQEYPHYSTDIAAAWKVVEKMRERGYPTITVCLSERAEPTVTVWLPEPDKHGNYCRSVWAPTVPLAICMAALRAVRED